MDINPGRLHDEGLAAAIADLAAPLAPRGVEVELDVPPDLALPRPARTCSTARAREGLRNAGAHAGARRVAVRADVTAAGRACGSRTTAAASTRRRASGAGRRAISGCVLIEDLARAPRRAAREVRSSPGQGTVLEVEVPV